MYGVIRRIRRFRNGEKGFTLIELLVVIIIIAILAAIAIPTFLGQRRKAQDAAAKALVRNAMTAVEASFVDNQTYAIASMTVAVLQAIEPSVHFFQAANAAATTPAFGATVTAANCPAKTSTVGYDGAATNYSIATVSISDNIYGVYVDKAGTGATFIKKVGSTVSTGW